MDKEIKNNGHFSLQFPVVEKANTTTVSPKPKTKPEVKTGVKPELKKKEIPPQIDDVEKELKERGGKGLYIIEDKKDKAGNLVKTRTGKIAAVLNPYRIGVLRVKQNRDGDYKLQWTKKDNPNKFTGVGITEKEYNSFLSTASVNKRLDLLLKYKRELIKKNIKNDELLKLRCTIDEKSMLNRIAKECGVSVSELVRMRINNTQPHVPFTEKERELQDIAMQRIIEMEKFRIALNNYIKTTGIKGVQRLDAIFNSKPGTDYACEIWNVIQYLKKLFKIKEEV